jgi:CheY-like chemotaxis protein
LLETIVQVLQVAAQTNADTSPPLWVPADRAAIADKVAEPSKPDAKPSGPGRQPTAGGQASASSHLELLVAEDNEVNQIVFTQILDELGLHYKIVDNGGSAFEVWKSHHPALILMDVSMPVMNGHQATQAIRKAEQEEPDRGRTPIVGVTAHALAGDKERCLDAGMDDYLSKPISPEKLEAKIREWLPADIAAKITHG